MCMRAPRGIVVIVVGLAACNPPLALQYRQALQPVPAADCVAAAIAASPSVARIATLERHSAFFSQPPGVLVSLRDSAVAAPALSVSVTQAALPDSGTRLAVTYVFVGYAAPTAEQRAQWAALADSLLAAVRAACAGGSAPAPVECRQLRWAHHERACEAT